MSMAVKLRRLQALGRRQDEAAQPTMGRMAFQPFVLQHHRANARRLVGRLAEPSGWLRTNSWAMRRLKVATASDCIRRESRGEKFHHHAYAPRKRLEATGAKDISCARSRACCRQRARAQRDGRFRHLVAYNLRASQQPKRTSSR